MTVADLEVAQAIAALYDPLTGSDPAQWLHLDTGGDDDQIYWAIKLSASGVPIVVYRGSKLLVDWERDFEAVPYQENDLHLGLVHGGMYKGVPKSCSEAAKILGNEPYILAGHSLGAGRAAQAAGIGVATGRPPLALILFGEPRAGGDRLVSVLSSIPVRSYRNGGEILHDPVTDLPPSAPIPFRHAGGAARPLIDVHELPSGADVLVPTAYHSFSLYEKAIARLSPMPQT